MFRLSLRKKINAPYTGAESEEEDEGGQFTQHERRCSQDIYGGQSGIRAVEKRVQGIAAGQ